MNELEQPELTELTELRKSYELVLGKLQDYVRKEIKEKADRENKVIEDRHWYIGEDGVQHLRICACRECEKEIISRARKEFEVNNAEAKKSKDFTPMQITKIVIALVFGSYFFWWSAKVLEALNK